MTTGMPIMISVFPPGDRGKMLGINVSAVYLGLSMGPFFGGFLTQQLGWRSIFLICIPVGLIAVILTFIKLKKFTDTKHQDGIDFFGSLCYIFALIGLVYGSINLGKNFGWMWFITGIFFFVLFLVQSNRTKFPVFEIRLFTRNRLFAFSNLAALINYSATFAIVFLLSLHLQKVKALSPQAAGIILISQPIVMTLLSPVAGRLSDRWEPRLLASLGMFLNAVGLFLLSTISQSTSNGTIVALLLFMGFGFALFSSPTMNTIMSSVERKHYGIASGTSATMRVLGQMVSMSVATMIFAFYFGSGQIKNVPVPVFVKSEQISFLVFGCLCLTGVYFSFSRGKLRG
jgi:MFS family permease